MMYSNFTETVVFCQRSHSHKEFDMFLSDNETKSLKDSDKHTDYYELWTAVPDMWSIIVYSVIIPVVSGFGIIGNALILMVHYQRNLRTSTYTYLAVLASSDLVTCILLLFSGLARGVFRCYTGWLEFDAFVYFPIGSISSNITVWAALGVSVDRLIIVCSMPKCKRPKFCDQRIARKLMSLASCFAIFINIPFCFIYEYNKHGDLVTTKFFHSWWYNLQNWFQFMIFGLIPVIFLLIANGIMYYSVRKALKQRQLLLKRKNIREGNRLRDQARLTTMLIGIVFVFLVGELPTHLVSRRSAVTLLYGGDVSKVQEILMDRFRMWATLLNVIASSANFILYCLLSPCFLPHLRYVLRGETIMKKTYTKKSKACFHQRSKSGAKCEIFVL